MRQTDKKLIIDNGFWRVFQTFFEANNRKGNVITMEKTQSKEGCFILPLTSDNQIIINKEFLFGQNEYQYILPGGSIEGSDSMLETLSKELYEETGYKSSKFIYLGKYNNNNYIKGKSLLYLGLNCKKEGNQELQDIEDIEVLKTSIEGFEKMIQNNEIHCPWTELAFKKAKEITNNFTSFNL